MDNFKHEMELDYSQELMFKECKEKLGLNDQEMLTLAFGTLIMLFLNTTRNKIIIESDENPNETVLYLQKNSKNSEYPFSSEIQSVADLLNYANNDQ